MSKAPITLDATACLEVLESALTDAREKMQVSTAPQRYIAFGVAMGLLSSLRLTGLITQADYDQRLLELGEALGAEG